MFSFKLLNIKFKCFRINIKFYEDSRIANLYTDTQLFKEKWVSLFPVTEPCFLHACTQLRRTVLVASPIAQSDGERVGDRHGGLVLAARWLGPSLTWIFCSTYRRPLSASGTQVLPCGADTLVGCGEQVLCRRSRMWSPPGSCFSAPSSPGTDCQGLTTFPAASQPSNSPRLKADSNDGP